MRLVIDFLPLLLFFGAFKLAEARPDDAAALVHGPLGFLMGEPGVHAVDAPMMIATLVVIVAAVLQVSWLIARRRRIEPMLWLSLVLVLMLGGTTVWLHDASFIKWKPSLLYWSMGLVLWASQVLLHCNLLRALMGHQLQLPSKVWRRLNFTWVTFFGCMGLLNVWVAHTFSTEAWVEFKVFGAIGMLLVFALAQGVYLSRHLPEAPRRRSRSAGPTGAGAGAGAAARER